jgi:hypothetical protein
MTVPDIARRINEAADAVTLKHPFALDCTIYRKVVKRAADSTMGGAPTLGGLGVLSPDDEDQYEYEEVGEAKLLITDRFEGDIDTTDREDGYVPPAMQQANIVATSLPKFAIEKYDVAAAMPGGGVVVAFEILRLPTTTSIYPYTTKFVIAPRDDLHTLIPTS